MRRVPVSASPDRMSHRRTRRRAAAVVSAAAVLPLLITAGPSAAVPPSTSGFVTNLNTIQTIASTVPKNGDVNPYGVAVVPKSNGSLVAGNVLVSNFNNHRNLQGTGTTIVQVSPDGRTSLFSALSPNKLPGACPGGLGLTTALVALESGWVVVGSLPTKDGTSATMKAGCLIVIDPTGRPVETISGGPINGPWDMTALDNGSTASLFVTNVLNGTVAAGGASVPEGTVVRVELSGLDTHTPQVGTETVIANGLSERTDPGALVVGPTGLGLGADGTLYIADSADNKIVSVANASGTTPGPVVDVTSASSPGGINDPLGLAIVPGNGTGGGDILTSNGGDGNLVETTPGGTQVAVKALDTTPAPPGPNGNGALFGLAVIPGGSGLYYVDDATNTLNSLT